MTSLLQEEQLHISVLEMKAFQLTQNAFPFRILGESVIMSNNATVVAYLKKQVGMGSRMMCSLAWLELL